MQYSADNPRGTFYYEDAPDFPESTFVGYMPEILHYWRIMQLLAAVGDRPRAVAAEPASSLAKRTATSGEGRAWSLMLPKEAGIREHHNPPIWAWWSRIVDVSCVTLLLASPDFALTLDLSGQKRCRSSCPVFFG